MEEHYSERLKDSIVQNDSFNMKVEQYMRLNEELKHQMQQMKMGQLNQMNQSIDSQNSSSIFKESLRMSELMSPKSMNLGKNEKKSINQN